MKYLLCLSFVAVVSTLFAGCATRRQIQVIERVTKDTIYLNKVQYDSIYIDKAKYVDRTRDTLLIQDKVVEYRYKLLRDTIRIHQIDSIPVIREVEVVREIARTPWYAKLLATVGLVGIFLFIFKIRKSCR